MEFLNSNQLAARWQKSPDFIYQNQDRLGIPKIMVGREYRYPLAEIEHWESRQLFASEEERARKPVARLRNSESSKITELIEELAWQLQTERRNGFTLAAKESTNKKSLNVVGVSSDGEVSLKVNAPGVHKEILSTLGFDLQEGGPWVRNVAVSHLANLLFSLLNVSRLVGKSVTYSLGSSPLDLRAALAVDADFASTAEIWFRLKD